MFKISVIVPVYNVETYLRECIDSIINQTYKNLEIILVDDGSTDSSPAICDQYAQKDRRILVIHKGNGGASDARNAGLDVATGDYIGFIDSDDYIEADMYEVLLNNAIKYKADISCCRYSEVYEDGSTKDYGNNIVTLYPNQEGLIEYLLGKTIDPFVCNKLYSAHMFNHVRFATGLILGEDNKANCDLFLRARSSVLDAQPKYKYRQNRPGAYTQKGILNQERVSSIYSLETIYRDCLKNCQSLEKYVLRRQVLFYIGMYNKIVLYGRGFGQDKYNIICFLKDKEESILNSDITELQLKLAVFLLCRNTWIYEIVMRLYKRVFPVARI